MEYADYLFSNCKVVYYPDFWNDAYFIIDDVMKNYKKTALLAIKRKKRGRYLLNDTPLNEAKLQIKITEQFSPIKSDKFKKKNTGFIKLYTGYFKQGKGKTQNDSIIRKLNNCWLMG